MISTLHLYSAPWLGAIVVNVIFAEENKLKKVVWLFAAGGRIARERFVKEQFKEPGEDIVIEWENKKRVFYSERV